jgi:hypothetical protein
LPAGWLAIMVPANLEVRTPTVLEYAGAAAVVGKKGHTAWTDGSVDDGCAFVISQWCWPERRQHDGSFDSASAHIADGISGKLKKARSRVARVCRTPVSYLLHTPRVKLGPSADSSFRLSRAESTRNRSFPLGVCTDPLAASAEKQQLLDGAPHLSKEIFHPGRLPDVTRSSYPLRALHVRG